MSYKAVRLGAGRTGWAVVMTVHSSKRCTVIKKNLTKNKANDIAQLFNEEVGA